MIAEDMRKTSLAIEVLREHAGSFIMKDISDACIYGADILEDYLKYLREKVTSGAYTS